MANLRFCDKLIANRRKIAICIPSHTIAITVRELLGFSAVARLKPVRVVSYRGLVTVKLSLEIMRKGWAHSQTQLAAVRR